MGRLFDRLDMATRMPQWIVGALIGLVLDEIDHQKLKRHARTYRPDDLKLGGSD